MSSSDLTLICSSCKSPSIPDFQSLVKDPSNMCVECYEMYVIKEQIEYWKYHINEDEKRRYFKPSN